VRVPTRIAINGNPPAAELGPTNLPPPDRPGSRHHVPRLRHSSRARKECCHETPDDISDARVISGSGA
jgi:hypothetical protein